MASPSTSFTLPNGRSISYELSIAPNDGLVVLLSNSLCGPLRIWDRVAAVLASAGFRVLRYDQPGHGASGVPAADHAPTTFASMAKDVHALLQHLQIAKLHAWVGVSMGASTGIYFAAKYPGVVHKLVPCDTISCAAARLGVTDPFPPRVAAARAAGSLDDVLAATAQRWFGETWLAANPAEAARVRAIMATTSLGGFVTCCAALSDPEYDLRSLVELAGRGCEEALVVVGEKDANLPTTMQELRAGLAKGTGKAVELRVIKNAGHVVFVDGFDEFCGVLLPFLKK